MDKERKIKLSPATRILLTTVMGFGAGGTIGHILPIEASGQNNTNENPSHRIVLDVTPAFNLRPIGPGFDQIDSFNKSQALEAVPLCTVTPIPTETPLPTITPTPPETLTLVPSPTDTETPLPPTPTPTQEASKTTTETQEATQTLTQTKEITQTETQMATGTNTPENTTTNTPTPTLTEWLQTKTAAVTATLTQIIKTFTSTPTPKKSPTPTITPTPSTTPTITLSSTLGNTSTATGTATERQVSTSTQKSQGTPGGGEPMILGSNHETGEVVIKPYINTRTGRTATGAVVGAGFGLVGGVLHEVNRRKFRGKNPSKPL